MPLKLVPVATSGSGTLYEICASDPSTGQHIGIGYTALDIDGNPIAVALDTTVQASNALLTEINAALGLVATEETQHNISLSLSALAGVIGNPADPAWGGTGSADVIPILKGIFTAAGATVTALGHTLTVTPAGSGPGTDESANSPNLLKLQKTLEVTNPGNYFVQNQSDVIIQAVFDDGTNTPTVVLLASGGLNQPGGFAPPMPGFTGRIRVCAPDGAPFAARAI